MLGEKFIDEEEMEDELNKQGSEGWELVSVVREHDGLLAVCKRANGRKSSLLQPGKQQPAAAKAALGVPAKQPLPASEGVGDIMIS